MTFHSRLGAAPGLIAALLLAACGASTNVPFAQPAPNPTALASMPPTALATIESITPTPEPEGYWIQPGVPQSLIDSIAPALQNAGLVPVDTPDAAIVRLMLNPGADAALTARWVYAVAAPFATIPDDISWAALQGYWRYGSLDGMPAFNSPPQIVLTPDVAALLTGLLGQPAEGLPLQVVDAASLTDTAWSLRPSISLLPFDTLTPRWKVLTLDGQSVLDRALNTDTYPLAVSVGLVGTGERGAQVVAGLQTQGLWAATNRDPAHITVVVVTGVTALVRATAKEMEIHGVDFPAEKILPFFADADILHTSNEVSFASDCPAPQWIGEPKDFLLAACRLHAADRHRAGRGRADRQPQQRLEQRRRPAHARPVRREPHRVLWRWAQP